MVPHRFRPSVWFKNIDQRALKIQADTRLGRLPKLTAAPTDLQRTMSLIVAWNIAAQTIKPQTFSICGFLPVAFTLFALHMMLNGSWYLILLSFSLLSPEFLVISTLFTISKLNSTLASS